MGNCLATRRRRRGRLVRHYFLISLILIAGGLITSALSRSISIAKARRYRPPEREAAAVAVEDRTVRPGYCDCNQDRPRAEVMQSKVSPEYRFELKRLSI
jgi:hypothetical protein